MPLSTLSRFLFLPAAAFAFLAPAAVRGQAELKIQIPGARFSLPRYGHAVLTAVPDGLQIQALDRNDLFISSALPVAPGGSYAITRVVVRFRSPANYGATLGSVRLTGEYGGKLLDVEVHAGGDRSSSEVYDPARSANAWRMQATGRPMMVNGKTIVRLGISSPLPIDPEGNGAPPANYQPRGSPFLLLSVDVYVKNPN